jgi:hypothetical protein
VRILSCNGLVRLAARTAPAGQIAYRSDSTRAQPLAGAMSLGHARRRSTSSAGKNLRPLLSSPNESLIDTQPDFQPCAATASIFLFAQGCTIYCLHHDTLTVERKFEKHRQPVILLSVDNVSERGAGRLVVSYDVERTAIVWDLFTGDEITRFASFKPLKVAAWMKNGNIAFGMFHCVENSSL